MKRFLFLLVSLICNTYLFADGVGTEFAADVNGIMITFTITNNSDNNYTAKVGRKKGTINNIAVIPSEVYKKKIEIPENIYYKGTYYKVTEIGDYAFYGCGLYSVTFPNSIVSIGERAFMACYLCNSYIIPVNVTYIGYQAFPEDTHHVEFHCRIIGDWFKNYNNLSNVVIGDEVVEISHEAFYGCSRLTSIVIPNTVTSIGSGAFSYTGLTSVEIPKSITSIYSTTFAHCHDLTSIQIPNSITSIGAGAFRDCQSLISIEIPNSVTDIGASVFEQCEKLTSVNIPNGVTSINDKLFYNCYSLANITLPESITKIGAGAFYLTDLTSIKLPSSVVSIGNQAFDGCWVSTISIPKSVKYIGSRAFHCLGLKNIYSSLLVPFAIPDNVFPTYDKELKLHVFKETKYAYLGTKGWDKFDESNILDDIETNVFVENNGDCKLKYTITNSNATEHTVSVEYWKDQSPKDSPIAINIPRTVYHNDLHYYVTEIKDRAFYNCSSLTSVIIPHESVVLIGNDAFYGCSDLTSVTIPYGVKSLGDGAFYGCSGLTSVAIPLGVKSLGDGAFYGCTGLTSVIIPKTVNVIGKQVFSGCSSLPSVTIPNGVETIGELAFENCSNLISVTIPSSVTSINSAFNGCSRLTSVTVESAIPPTIEINSAFPYRDRATLYVPVGSVDTYKNSDYWKEFRTIVEIGDEPPTQDYTDEQGVTYTLFTDGNYSSVTGYTNACTGDIIIPESVMGCSVSSIGDRAFLDCTGLTSVMIPNSVTSIGAAAFGRCSSLTSVTILNGVTSIGMQAFAYCSSLNSIKIPMSLETIVGNAFQDCSNLNSVFITDLTAWCNISPLPNFPVPYHLFLNGVEINDLVIPNNVTSIPGRAFAKCGYLTSVSIPNGVTSIAGAAFRDCDNLTSVTIDIAEPLIISSNVFTNRTNATLFVPGGCAEFYKTADFWKDFKAIVEIGDETASYYTDEQGVKYTFDDDGEAYIVSGHTEACTGNIIIPESVNGHIVTSIGNSAFYDCRDLISVTIPNSVTSIGEWAFGWTGLTSVSIPKSVNSIGYMAFQSCNNLMSVSVEARIPLTISPYTFSNKENATLYLLSIGSKEDYENATEWKEFKNIVYRDANEVNIDGLKFLYSSSSENAVVIPDDYSQLTSVTIPSSITINSKSYNVTEISSRAFYGCSGLTSVTIPNSVTMIGDNAFSGCSGLTSVTIPNSVTMLGESALEDCSGLTSVTIECNLTDTKYNSYYNYTFLNCSNIKEVTFNCNKVYSFFKGMTSVEKVTMTELVEEIGSYAFYGCSSLTSATIPNSVISIGYGAFYGCSGLTSVTIPNGVASIGERAFLGCSGLTSLTIPNSVTSIGSSAFANCSGLASVTVKSSVPLSIDEGTFYPCNLNAKLYVPIGSKAYYEEAVGWQQFSKIVEGETVGNLNYYYNVGSGNAMVVVGDYSNLTSINIPAKITIDGKDYVVTCIGDDAFRLCSSLKSVTIPNGVVSIGERAFNNCECLTSMTIPSSVTTIGAGAFHNCRSLTSMTIPSSVTTIGARAFYLCKGLTSMTIPSSVTLIGESVFENCNNLSSIIVESGNTIYDSRDDCNAIIETGTNTLIAGCCNTTIPTGVTSIGNYAFRGQTGLTSITFPTSVTSIGNYAFCDCRNLTSVTIPNSVTSIGGYAFSGCSGLLSVIVESITPLVISSVTFGSFTNATLYVPIGSKEAYQEAVGWNKFNSIVEVDLELILPKAKSGLIYTGSAQDLINASTISTMQYSLDDMTYSTAIPQGMDAGEYIVYYKDDTFGIANSFKVVIAGKTVSSPTISLSQTSYTCNGFAKQPEVTVKDGSTIIPPEEYLISYSDNTNVGTATVLITDKEGGNYIVSGSTSFVILRAITDLFYGSYLLSGYVAQEDLALPAGLKAYVITSLGLSSATASEINYIPKGEPVLLKRDNDNTNSFEALAGTGTPPTTNLLQAYIIDKTVSNREGYVLYKDEFVLVNEGTLPAGRIFLPLNGANAAATRGIVIEGEGTTGIWDSVSDAEVSHGAWYDLQGRKLDGKPIKKGVYILNGSKVVVK